MTEDGNTAPSAGESWTNPFTAEFERRKAEVLAMPGFELKLDLEALGRAGRVNYKNQQELTRHAGLFLNSGRHYNTMTHGVTGAQLINPSGPPDRGGRPERQTWCPSRPSMHRPP